VYDRGEAAVTDDKSDPLDGFEFQYLPGKRLTTHLSKGVTSFEEETPLMKRCNHFFYKKKISFMKSG
jgi:hypothetical protein